VKKVIIKKTHKGMTAQYYARIPIDGTERMAVLCTVAEVEAQRDPEAFLHHRLIEATLKVSRRVETPKELKPQKGISLAALRDRWIDSLATAERTRTEYTRAVGVFLAHHPDATITDLKATSTRPMIKAMVEQGRSANTIRSYIRTVQIMLRYAQREGLVETIPQLEQPSEEKRNIRVYTEDELNRVEAHLRDQTRSQPEYRNRYRAHMMLRYLGLRAGEVWSLRLDSIDLKNKTLTIRAVDELGWKPKKGKEAVLPLGGKLATFLEEDLQGRNPQERYYLDKGNGRTYTVDVSTLNNSMSRVMARLGLGNTAKTLHGYRASAITRMLEAGVAPHEVQAVARHEDLKTTLGYLHRRGADGRALATLD